MLVFDLPATQIGPLGITLSVPADDGGSDGQDAVSIPILKLKWADDRQWCKLAHEWRAAGGGALPEFEKCGNYRDGRCGSKRLCVFLESAEAVIWTKIRSWRLRPDGALESVLGGDDA